MSKKPEKKPPTYAERLKALEKKNPGLFGHDIVERVPTRFLRLDHALGGGLGLGRIYELYGPEGGYKTTLATSWAGDIVKARKGAVLYLDHEHTYEQTYATKLGLRKAQVVTPDYFEQGAEIAIELVKTGGVSVVVLDSIAGLATKEIFEGEMEKKSIASLARAVAQFLYKMTPLLADHKTVLICINQVREKPGVRFGSPETTPGGHVLRHHASVRLRCSKTQEGVWLRIKKNKLTGVRDEFLYDGTDGDGFDLWEEVLRYAEDHEVIGVTAGGVFEFKVKGKVEKIRGRRKAAARADELVRAIRRAAK